MITRVQGVNIFSWAKMDEPVSPGVTLYDGWNDDDNTSEGSGKSSVMNTATWCLFGKIPKEANIDDVVKVGEKSCAAVVTLSNGDQVVRTRGPNDLYLVIDKKKVKGKDARETQKLIVDRIGLTYETFLQVVYFAQNYAEKFISSNQEKRGQLLSEIQDLNQFDRAIKEVKSLLKLETSSLTDLRHRRELNIKDLSLIDEKIKSINEAYERSKAHIEDLKESAEERLKDVAKEYKAKEARIKESSENITKLESALEKMDIFQAEEALVGLRMRSKETQEKLNNISALKQECRDKVRRAEAQEARLKSLVAKVKKLQEFIANPSKECPSCGTQLGEHDTSHAETEVSELKAEIIEVDKALKALKKELAEPAPTDSGLRAEMQELQEAEEPHKLLIQRHKKAHEERIGLKAQIKSDESRLEELKDRLLKGKKELEKIREMKPEYDEVSLELLGSQQADLNEKVLAFEGILREKEAYVNRLETLKNGFREVKSYVFNSALNQINARVKKYLEKLFDVPAQLEFINDNMKIETKSSLNGVPRGLGLLSGGQFRRFSLAVDLALNDVVSARSNTDLGILMLDEYFKDLSEQSMEKCLRLLQERKTPVLLVEHNSIFKSIVSQSRFVRCSGGTSRFEPS